MSVRSCVAAGGVLIGLAAVPATALGEQPASAAQAKKKRPPALRVTDQFAVPSSVQAGSRVVVRGRVWNAKGRRRQRGRLIVSLRESADSTSGERLARRGVRLRAGRSRSFRMSVLIPNDTAAGRYRLFICASPGKGRRVRCRTRGLTITRPPATLPAPPAPTPPAPAPDNRSASEKLRAAVSVPGMTGHLNQFQSIADANGGNRASGFQGFGASVQYVTSVLRAAGYSPRTEVFDFVLFSEVGEPAFERTAPTQETYENGTEFATMSYSASGDVTAPLEAVDVNLAPPRDPVTSGCEADDFDGFTAGNVALMQRGSCDFYVKAINAQEAGASAAVVFNQGNAPDREGVVLGTLGEPAQDGDPATPEVTIPVVGTSFAIGENLATTPGAAARVMTEVENEPRTSTNVLADTPGGNPANTIIVGSHLDSVEEGPGINDNGSGSAFNLELAVQMAKLGIQPANRMRFAFWGAEESGLVGATKYVAAISDEEFAEIGMNLNFDMIASPNFARFVYDGDFSDTPPPATAPDINAGAVEIERAFVSYFDSQGLASEPSAFDGRSDYKPFQDFGVAAGGLFTGAEVDKTAAQVDLYGGTAGIPFDPNYHEVGDTIANINATGYEQMADAGAYVAGTYAMDAGYRQRFETAQMSGVQALTARPAVAGEYLGHMLQR
jgi:Zn-dependent M28 family amino/carboxypeptidase